MRRINLVVALLMLGLPASAAAAGSSGVVLSVDPGHHRLVVVDTGHVVHDYSYRGRLPRVQTGTPISFRRRGSTISRVKAAGGPAQRSRRVSYYARVVRCTNQGLVLALADGQRLRFSAGQLGHKRVGLRPGVTVMVAERIERHGGVTITISQPSSSSSSSPSSPGSPSTSGQPPADGSTGPDEDETGTITNVSGTGLTVATQDNGSMTFVVDSSDVTDGYAVGDVVDVTYDQVSGGSLDAWDVEYVQQESTGLVTAVSGASVTLTDDTTGQPVTITADPSDGMYDGVAVGDQVDATYHQSGSQLVADQVDDSGPPS